MIIQFKLETTENIKKKDYKILDEDYNQLCLQIGKQIIQSVNIENNKDYKLLVLGDKSINKLRDELNRIANVVNLSEIDRIINKRTL